MVADVGRPVGDTVVGFWVGSGGCVIDITLSVGFSVGCVVCMVGSVDDCGAVGSTGWLVFCAGCLVGSRVGSLDGCKEGCKGGF